MRTKLRLMTILMVIMCCCTQIKAAPLLIEYGGYPGAMDIIGSTDFRDVRAKGEDYWAAPAIYTIAALGVTKGITATEFAPDQHVTHSQTLAMVLRALGMESAAEYAADTLKSDRQSSPSEFNGIDTWADGYYQYALDSGIITDEQFESAMSYEPEAYDMPFVKTAPATREEIATIIAKALMLTEEEDFILLSTFDDYELVEEEFAPYVEATLRGRIMRGADRMFRPKDNITRAELAQTIKNMESNIYDLLGLQKVTAEVTKVEESEQKLYRKIIKRSRASLSGENKQPLAIAFNEEFDENGKSVTGPREVVVVRNNSIGGLATLVKGDKIEFMYDLNAAVRFVIVTDAVEVDQEMVTGDATGGVGGIVTGLVQSISSTAIVLYDEDGLKDPSRYRQVQLASGNSLRITKSGNPASLKDIREGDYVYVRLGMDGLGFEISSANRVQTVLGKVLSQSERTIDLQIDNGTKGTYTITSETLVTKNGKPMSMNDVYEGLSVRLTVQSTATAQIVMQMDLDRNDTHVGNVYRATLDSYDNDLNRLEMTYLRRLVKGSWNFADSKGMVAMPLTDSAVIYGDNGIITRAELAARHARQEVFVVTQRFADGKERAAYLRVNTNDPENIEVFTDVIEERADDDNLIVLSNWFESFYLNEDTLVVKEGRRIPNASLGQYDYVDIVAKRRGTSDAFDCVMVMVDKDKMEANLVEFYYGYLTRIDPAVKIEMDVDISYSADFWSELSLEKTFKLTTDTWYYNYTGRINNRQFSTFMDVEEEDGYGDEYIAPIPEEPEEDEWIDDTGEEEEYGERTVVNVAVVGDKVVAVANGEQIRYKVRGSLESFIRDSSGIVGFNIASPTYNDPYGSAVWRDANAGGRFYFAPNTMIIKNNKAVTMDALRYYDELIIYKTSKGVGGEALIILVE